MLKALMKAAGIKQEEKPVEAAAEPTQELTLVVDTSAVQAELDGLRAEFESFKETAEQMVAVAEAQVAELKAALDAANAALAAAEVEKIDAEAAAEAQRLAARKEKVEAAIGTEKAAGLLAATENLDDAAFEAVVSALAGSIEAEAKTSLFKETGVAAEADAAQVEESETMRILKAKYQGK